MSTLSVNASVIEDLHWLFQTLDLIWFWSPAPTLAHMGPFLFKSVCPISVSWSWSQKSLSSLNDGLLSESDCTVLLFYFIMSFTCTIDISQVAQRWLNLGWGMVFMFLHICSKIFNNKKNCLRCWPSTALHKGCPNTWLPKTLTSV